MNSAVYRYLLASGCALLAPAVHAHTEVGVAGGLVSGLLHPVLGLDHLLAMVAVGLWGAQLGRPAIYLLPVAFPAVMAVGAVAGILDLPLPGVEFGVSLSAVLLGAAVAFRFVPPIAVAVLLVSAFGIWHGYAHGLELPEATNALAYGVGFITATGLLHLCGIALGELHRWPLGSAMIQTCGGLIAAGGVFFLSRAFGVFG